jgi:hypothetical protein
MALKKNKLLLCLKIPFFIKGHIFLTLPLLLKEVVTKVI